MPPVPSLSSLPSEPYPPIPPPILVAMSAATEHILLQNTFYYRPRSTTEHILPCRIPSWRHHSPSAFYSRGQSFPWQNVFCSSTGRAICALLCAGRERDSLSLFLSRASQRERVRVRVRARVRARERKRVITPSALLPTPGCTSVYPNSLTRLLV